MFEDDEHEANELSHIGSFVCTNDLCYYESVLGYVVVHGCFKDVRVCIDMTIGVKAIVFLIVRVREQR